VLFPLATFASGAIIHGMKLKPDHPALTEARTIHTKTRKLPFEGQVIKAVANNGKLGKGQSVITKGKWRGMPMYSITLEERATCPSTCMRWSECFGNGMGFAHRFQHGPDLEAKIKAEVAFLAKIHPQGFVIRLHVLGDFYSLDYVDMWFDLMYAHENLHVFGYTAHLAGRIAGALHRNRIYFRERWWVRISANGEGRANGDTIYAGKAGEVKRSITCPEQTGQTESCLTCGLCWSINTTIGFIDHDQLQKQRKNNATLAT